MIEVKLLSVKKDCCDHKIVHVSLMVTTSQKPIVDSQKIKRKASKYITIKNHQISKEDSKRKEQKN